MKLSRSGWRLIRPPKILYAVGLGRVIGWLVLMLGTVGRRSGQLHWVPLQYENIDGVIHLGSARGMAADWMRNAAACPDVKLRIGARRLDGLAEVLDDPERIVKFLEYRLKHRPRMMAQMLKLEGVPPNPTRTDLLKVAERITVLAIHMQDSLN